MHNESFKIIFRRGVNRILETGLLILTVALGVGAAAAGLSLLMSTQQYANELIDSPTYQELVVSVPGESDDMETPVIRKPSQEKTVLTQSDLSAAELIPTITYAYVSNTSRINFVNEETVIADQQRISAMVTDGEDSEEIQQRGVTYSIEELEELSADSGIVVAEIDELSGYQVSSDFFHAWDITPVFGSLFSDSDFSDTDSIIILGSDAAALLTPPGEQADYLLGKKLLTRQGYQTVIGILAPTGDTYDSAYFAPYRDGVSDASLSGPRTSRMSTQLRFTVDSPEHLDSSALLLSDWFASQFGEDQIVLSNPRAEAEQLIHRNTGIGLLILFLSLAGLFIASVNVSHILMSRVIRMKKHVGILMALGATRNHITGLFAAESLLITGIGSFLGAIFAIPLTSAMQGTLGLTGSSIGFIMIGVLIAASLTFLFGLLPIRQYTHTQPADAMRTT